MIDGKEETLISGRKCYSVTGRDEVLRAFVDELRTSNQFEDSDLRVIGGVDATGRMKIILAGHFVDEVSFQDFKKKFINPYKLKQED